MKNPIEPLFNLHKSTQTGKYPAAITAEILANTQLQGGWTALHLAAIYGNFPPNTKAQTLADAKDTAGRSALHEAATHGTFPPDITATLLKTTLDAQGNSAWTTLCNCLANIPATTLRLPHHLFADHLQLAITTINATVTDTPNLQLKSAIWLGQVLALQSQQLRWSRAPK